VREKPFTKHQMKQTIYFGVLAWLLLLIVYLSQIYGVLPRGRFANLIAGAVYIFPPFFAFLIYQKRSEYLKGDSNKNNTEPKGD